MNKKSSLTRADFLRLSLGAATGLSLSSVVTSCKSKPSETKVTETPATAAKAVTQKYSDHPGLQLYTLREDFAKDPAGTLKKIADLGYKELEFYDASMLAANAKTVNDLGMKIVSSHCLPGFVTGSWEAAEKAGAKKPANYTFENILDDCKKNDVHNLVVAYLFPDERKEYVALGDKLNKAGEKAKAMGIQLYYHNHSFEFDPSKGERPIDLLLKNTDPHLVMLELDCFWTSVSGNNAADFIRQHSDRVGMLHLKDVKAGTPTDYTTNAVAPEAFQALGDGTVDYKSVLAAANEIGVKYTFVEQDHSKDRPAIESIARSIKYLKDNAL